MNIKNILFFFLLFLISIPALAQRDIAKTHAERQTLYKNLLIKEKKGMMVNGKLYNNTKEARYGTPFLFNDNWNRGTITIDGQEYDSAIIRYEAYHDYLIYKHFHSSLSKPIVLIPHFIDSFTLLDHTFSYVNDSSIENLIPGYYELFHIEDIALYIKWTKIIQDKADYRNSSYRDEKTVFVQKDQKLNEIKNRRSYFKLLDDRKKEIKKYIRKNNIVLRDAKPETHLEIIKYYQSLNQSE